MYFIDIMINTFSIILDIFIFYYFLNIFLLRKEYSRKYKFLIFAFTFLIQFVLSIHINEDSLLRILYVFPCYLLFCLMLYKGKWYLIFVSILFFYLLNSISEALILTGFAIFNSSLTLFESMYNNQLMFFSFLMTRLIEIILIYAINIYKKRTNFKYNVIFLACFLVISFLFIIIMFTNYWKNNNHEINFVLIVFSIFNVIQFLFLFSYFIIVQNSTKRYYEIKESYEQQRLFFNTLSKVQQIIRKMGHDLKHHFIYIMTALEEEDISKAKNYLIGLDNNLGDLIPVKITGNNDIDAMLFGKAKLAARHKIGVIITGEVPEYINVSSIDMSVLLGNAFDNAIEAVDRENIIRKEIKLTFAYVNRRLTMIIENQYNGKIRKKANGFFITQKTIGGLGIEIMDQVVKKYNGVLLTNYDNENFTLTIILNVSKMNNDNLILEIDENKDIQII